MADAVVVWARRFAAVGLFVIVIYHVDEVLKAMGYSGFIPISDRLSRSMLFEVPTLCLSGASFAISWQKPLISVSIFLLIAGTLMLADAVAIGTQYFSILSVPGPIIGFFYGLAVLLLGIAKASMIAVGFRRPPLAQEK